MADTDPLQFVKDKFRSHPDLDVRTHDLTCGTSTASSRSVASTARRR